MIIHRATTVCYFLFVVILTTYSCWDYLIKYYGEKITEFHEAKDGRFFSPDHRYYLEYWTTSRYTLRVFHESMPGFIKVYDAKTKVLIHESDVFDLEGQPGIIWPCDKADPTLVVGMQTIMVMPTIQNCYGPKTTIY